MRREIFRMDRGPALELLRGAPAVHLATTTPEGEPVLRALDAAVLEDAIAFHGAPAGEKTLCIGRPAVVSAEQVVAHVPSWWIDPQRACPASTLYRSVQVKGPLLRVDDPRRKACVLETLMRRWQPEGRYAPIDPSSPLYRGAVEGTLVLEVPFERVDGTAKLLQNRRPGEVLRILEGLWERGDPGDAAAIELVREANPGLPDPGFLRSPAGHRLHAALAPAHAAEATRLLQDQYWWAGQPAARIAPVQIASSAWVGARDGEGALVATARAVSEGRYAWLYDVAVAPAHRGRGLGRRIVELLLDHPAVRRARSVRLATRDAQEFYARLGFRETSLARRPVPSTEMILLREDLGAVGQAGSRYARGEPLRPRPR